VLGNRHPSTKQKKMKNILVLAVITAVLAGCTVTKPQVTQAVMPPMPGQRMTLSLPSAIVNTNRIRGTNVYNPVLTNRTYTLSCSNKVQVLSSTDMINWKYFAMTDSNGISIYPSRTNLFFKAVLLEAKVVVNWDLPNNTNISGYKIYCGSKVGCYDITYYVPGAYTTNVVIIVPAYSTNYFVVTSITTNKESIFSTLSSCIVPQPKLVFK
jgi:hypothetical protein